MLSGLTSTKVHTIVYLATIAIANHNEQLGHIMYKFKMLSELISTILCTIMMYTLTAI